jgi:putative transcriptional regulator
MTLKNSIREHRTVRGFSQGELAALVGVTRQTIISLEKGNYVPSLLLAMNISEALDVPIDILFQKET